MSESSLVIKASTARQIDYSDRLQMAQKAMIGFIQGLFENRPVGHFRWLENDVESEIYIAGSDVEVGPPSTRPAIRVGLEGARWMGIGFSGTTTSSFSGGPDSFSDTISSAFNIVCYSKIASEAHRIGYLVFTGIRMFGSLINKIGHLQDVAKELTLGKVAAVSSGFYKDWVAVPLMAPFYVREHLILEQNQYYQAVFRSVATRVSLQLL